MLTAPRRDPDVPDGWDSWIAHCKIAYDRYDLSITGFLIEGHSPGIGETGMDHYLRLSPDGLVCHRRCDKTGLHRGVMPYVRHTQDISGTPEEAAKKILAEVDDSTTQFLFFRSVMGSPTWNGEVIDAVKAGGSPGRIEFVDPYTFFGLLKLHESKRQGKPVQQIDTTGTKLAQGAEA